MYSEATELELKKRLSKIKRLQKYNNIKTTTKIKIKKKKVSFYCL